MKAGLEGSSVCCCLLALHIQSEDHRLSAGVYLVLRKPSSKPADIPGILKQCPGFSIRIANSTEVWFPCPFAAVGCSAQPGVCLRSSCGRLLHFLPCSWWHTAIYCGITLAVMHRDLSLARHYLSTCSGHFADTVVISSNFCFTRDEA